MAAGHQRRQSDRFLHGLDFHVVAAESLSMSEKAGVFALANVVVSPAGSGYANMLFCKPQTKLVEIFNPAYVDTPAWLLCNELGLDYHYLRGEAHSQNIAPIKADIRVDIDHLSALLHLAGIR
ncbi:MAG: glycosyltransferase family 61 protein [Janthinobacterium lividum]